MIDITTTYLGLPMKSPIVASASPLCESLETYGISKTLGSGRSYCLPSLKNSSTWRARRSIPIFPAAAKVLPNRSTTCRICSTYNLGADGYLELIRKARQRVSIPVIASLNGCLPAAGPATPA